MFSGNDGILSTMASTDVLKAEVRLYTSSLTDIPATFVLVFVLQFIWRFRREVLRLPEPDPRVRVPLAAFCARFAMPS